jgi:NADH-quinone oxidoreductase subunit G
MADIAVDGRGFSVGGGQCALQALLELGYRLPYFCWHPALGSVGACRQCAVKQYRDEADERAGRGRLVMACMTAVADGLRLGFADAEAAAFRRAVIEGMMLHHPHDCPVCDEGGHCHLQDMTVMAGHTYRRTRFRKRTFRNQYLGPFLHHEMNRCIQCYRCVRFYREYAGGRDLEALSLRDTVYFGRERDGALESEFAGNLAEVCPTGVFTDATLKRHYTRKWDLRWAPSICAHCGVGCNTSLGERYGEARVTVNRYHGEINGYFLCDRGRYGYEYLAGAERLRVARWHGAPLAPGAALEKLQALIAEARRRGPGHIVGFGSPRASLEANFLLRELTGPERFFSADPDSELAALALALLRHGPAPGASLREAEGCDAALILGEDVTQSAARLALSLRQAARQQPLRALAGAPAIPGWLDHAAREALQDAHGPVYVLTPAATRLDAVATACHRAAPDDLARLGFEVARQIDGGGSGAEEWRAAAGPIAAALAAAERPLIITGTSCGAAALLEAATAVAAALRRRGRAPRLSVVLPEANTLGLAALAPAPLADGLDWARLGSATLAIALEADLTRRAPPRAAAEALAHFGGNGRHLVALDQIEHATAAAAALALPTAGAAEGTGTFVSFEGRAQRFFAALPPAAAVRESWRWLAAAEGAAPRLDAVLHRLAAALPELAGAARAAPGANFRLAQEKMPRAPARWSGRTAIDAGRDVSEPQTPADPDSALTFSMEGFAAQPPAALTAFFWSPGWNSPQAQLTYAQAINGGLRGGDAGVRLFDPDATAAPGEPPPRFTPQAGRFWVVRLPQLFGGETLSRLGRAIAQRAPAAYIGVAAAAAARAGWREGAELQLRVGEVATVAALRVLPELPDGVAAVPAGPAAFEAAPLPAWGEIG